MMSQVGYLKLLITQGILSGRLDFEIESRLYIYQWIYKFLLKFIYLL